MSRRLEGKKGRNPRTEEDSMLGVGRIMAFKCSNLLRERINGKDSLPLEGTSIMDDSIKGQRKANRERLHKLWRIAKTGNLESLSGEERRLAEIMTAHKDQYSSHFENAEQTYDHEYDTSKEENPFLHIMIHSAVERQLESKDPIEALQFYNSIRKRKVSRHDTIHLIGAILAPLMFEVMRHKVPFDKEKYKAALRKYKGKKPARIYESLEKKPSAA